MKTAALPSVRVDPTLRDDAESVLDQGETLSDFIVACVRSGIAWRRKQDAFLARANDAIDRGTRDSHGISPEELLKMMDDRLDAAQSRLPAAKPDQDIGS